MTAKTGKTVDIKTITSIKDDLVIISKQGTIIRTALKCISKIGRATQGVRIMKLSDGDMVTSIASIPKIVEEDYQGQTTEPNPKQVSLDLDAKPAKSEKKKESKNPVPQKKEKPKAPKPIKNSSGFSVKKVAEKSKGAPGFKVKKIK